MGVLRHHVAGREFGSTERTGTISNPATGAVVGEVAYASTADADAAIAAAKAALPAWKVTGLIKRADVFFRMRNLLVERQDELCLLYTSPSPRDGLLSRMPSSA